MKKLRLLPLLALIVCLYFIGCSTDENEGESGISNSAQVASLMNENLVLPPGAFTVNPENVTTDNSITIGTSNGVTPINSGQQMTNQISFNAPDGNVNAVGMRFGTNGPIYFVPINTGGATSGTGSFDFLINAGICNDLSRICHDIKCYEFAQTTSGAISRSNIRDVAMLCGNCDEPSCQGLVDPSDCPPSIGSGSFSSSISGNQSGNAGCDSGTIGVVNSTWVLATANLPFSGTVNFNSNYYTGNCTTCPALQISDVSGNAYVAVNGSGSWSGNVFSFNATLKNILDLAGGGTSYNITGSVNCNN
ncbi:hypothetical protein [Hyunsoonleella rubra]|uniref:Uncharacterized protein n=1 Tax=Hyunsoonleella rubra TaxID=1737062 RepID=A0ABW5TDM2_9FLAO